MNDDDDEKLGSQKMDNDGHGKKRRRFNVLR
jgi:hypothetical protein